MVGEYSILRSCEGELRLTVTVGWERSGSSRPECVDKRGDERGVEGTVIVAAEGPAYGTALVRRTSNLGLNLIP